MNRAFLCSVMQSGQHPIHAPGIRCDGHTSAGAAQLTAATDLVGHLVAGAIACRNVRFDGTVEHLLAGFDAGPVDGIEDGEALLGTWDLAAERSDRIGNEAGPRNEGHLFPVDFVSLQSGSFLDARER